MSQTQWIFVTLAVGSALIIAAATHDAGHPRLAPLVWTLATLLLGASTLTTLAGP